MERMSLPRPADNCGNCVSAECALTITPHLVRRDVNDGVRAYYRCDGCAAAARQRPCPPGAGRPAGRTDEEIRMSTEEQGFPPEFDAGALDRLAEQAGIRAKAAAPARWTCTRDELISALHEARIAPAALIDGFADRILAHLTPASEPSYAPLPRPGRQTPEPRPSLRGDDDGWADENGEIW